MPWNPEIYNQFKEIRYQPFYDLMSLIKDSNFKKAIDIGCGTGEQTAILSKQFPNAHFLGIDSSQEMLFASNQFESENLQFENSSIDSFLQANKKWDLIFSNAALQWVDNHNFLFPNLISKLNKGGQLAIQMPFQNENSLNRVLLELVQKLPFSDYLNGYLRHYPLLTIDEYILLMFKAGIKDIIVSLKVYPIIANDEWDLYNFIAGSALIPYMERLDPQQQNLLKLEFIEKIKQQFEPFPSIYPFRRIFLYGVKT